MLLNKKQAFFYFFMFFRADVFQVKLDKISSLFKTWRHTNYQTIKFLWLYLKYLKRNEK